MKHLLLVLCLFILLWGGSGRNCTFAQNASGTEQTDSLFQNEASIKDSLRLVSYLDSARKIFDKKIWTSDEARTGISYSLQAQQIAGENNDSAAYLKTLEFLEVFYRRIRKKDSAKYYSLRLSQIKADQGFYLPLERKFKNIGYASPLNDYLTVYYDSTGTISFDEITGINDFDRLSRIENLRSQAGAWWLRIRLKSRSDDWGKFTFYTGRGQNRWDSVSVYVPEPSGEYIKMVTGEALPDSLWLVPGESNHFQIGVPPGSDQVVYIRLRGAGSSITPDQIRLYIVNYEAFLRDSVHERHVNGVFQGIVLVQLVFFFLLFLVTKDKIYGNYTLYILGLGMFILTVNYFSEFPQLQRIHQVIMYMIAINLSVGGMIAFSYSYLNMAEYLPRWKASLKVFTGIYIFLSILFVVFIHLMFTLVRDGEPPIVPTFLLGIVSFILFLQSFAFLCFLPIWGFSVYNKGYSPAKYYLIAIVFLLLGFVVPVILVPFGDQLQSLGFHMGKLNPTILEGGIALQLCMFALAVGHKRNLLEKERREALEHNLKIQQQINAATDRFVPYEFLRTLGRESILDVNLGDQVEKNVTVFFSDIRDYTSLSEQMTPQQNFIFLNAYLGRIGPVIKTNRGFVNQYFGDGVLALFMSEENGIISQQDAVDAAMEMHREVRIYNEDRRLKQRDPIRIGIGIHNGPLMLGVIGDEKRMDVGVVSDTVNTAARLEGLTKIYGSTTIVSGKTYDALTRKEAFHYRPLGIVQVKGKKTPIRLFDIFDGDETRIFDLKAESRHYFLEGYEAYFAQKFDQAAKAFEAALAIFPGDLAARIFLKKAQYYLNTGVGSDWTGIEIIDRK